MKILHLATDAFGGHGGIAKYNRDLIRALCSLPEVEQVVSIPRIAPEPTGPLPDRLRFVTDALGGKGPYVRATLRELARTRADLVLCGHINLLPLAFVARARYGVPLALCIYGIDAWRRTGRLSGLLSEHVDSIISISQTTLDLFRSWARVPRSRCTLLPNAFDASEFGPGAPSSELLDRYGLRGKFVLLTVGRMAAYERYKGFDETLELLPSLVREIPNIAYLLVGDGADRQRLQEKALFLGLADRVVFTGKISEAEKADHYRLANVFVMASRGEGFGFVFLEAMACGIPVVASSADGSREAVRDGLLGELVDPNDPGDIRRGILAAAKRPRGVVPDGLDFFSFSNFENRLADWLRSFRWNARVPVPESAEALRHECTHDSEHHTIATLL